MSANHHNPSSTRASRSKTDGVVNVPLRGSNTFATTGATMWNLSKDLRQATSFYAAKKAANALALASPL